MTLENNFSIFYVFPYNSKNKGERQKWNSDSDSTSKNKSIKKTFFSYMTLNDNNTKILNKNYIKKY